MRIVCDMLVVRILVFMKLYALKYELYFKAFVMYMKNGSVNLFKC